MPTSATLGNLTRTVPTTNSVNQTIGASGQMALTLNPALSGNLVINNNIIVRLCLQRTGFNSARNVNVSLRRADTDALITGTAASANININTNPAAWNWFTFTITHTGPTTVLSAQNLRLRITNATATNGVIVTNNGANNQGNCAGQGPSRVEINTSTVINVSNVQVYNAASPGGVLITNTVENATVYVRGTITDPFGFADINNNTVVDILNNANSVVVGPINDTAILSSSGNTKIFEYAVTMPNDRLAGPFTVRVRGNEGTEGTITHYGASLFSLTDPPLLVVSKLSSKSGPGAAPGEDIDYQVIISNTSILGTGDATTVIVEDLLPKFTSFKIGSINYTNPYPPYSNSGLTVASTTYFNGVTWAYVPVSGGGGAPPGYDRNVQQIRVTFSGTMPPGGGFALDYIVGLN
jgi:uncharacterized repeat protein (TIGR01451 family)